MRSPLRVTVFSVASLLLAALAAAQDYPLSIAHKYGTTVIPAQPKRVASVDYAGADNILAVGLQPVVVRYWYGEYANSIWPWAQPLLSTEPEVIRGNLDYEQIARANPDIILAIRSGISKGEYRKLSKIAPVVVVPKGIGDYALTWQQQARLVGKVLGKSEQVEQRIAAIRAQLAEVRSSHPHWAGHTFAMATYWSGSVGVYSAEDSSVGLIKTLGLAVAPAVTEMTKPGQFYFTLSQEQLPLIDTDVLFWYTSDQNMSQIEALPMRPLLRANKEGREIMLPDTSLRNGALAYGSLLSVPEAIAQLVPLIEQAIDGNPATRVAAY